MAKGISKSEANAFLLKSNSKKPTADILNNLLKKESDFIEHTLNKQLVSAIDKIKEEIIKYLPHKEKEIRAVFDKPKSIDLKNPDNKTLAQVVSSSMDEKDKNLFKPEELDSFNSLLNKLGDKDLKQVLFMDRPLSNNPIFAKDIAIAKTTEFGKIAGLDEATVTKLVQKEIDFSRLNSSGFDDLVKDKTISAEQKKELQAVAGLSKITGENFDLINHLRTDKPLTPADLIAMDKKDWEKIITDKKIPLPEGEKSPETYAKNLQEIVENSFPTAFLMHHLKKNADPVKTIGIVKGLEPLMKAGISLFGKEGSRDLAEITKDEWKKIGADKKEEIEKSFGEIKSLINSYRSLGIEDIVIGRDSPEKKAAEINKRIEAVDSFNSNNPNINIAITDFTVDLKANKQDGLRWEGIAEDLRPMIKKQMAAVQRSYIMGGNQEVASKLLKNGFDSSARILAMTQEEFSNAAGLDIIEGRRVYRQANNLSIGAAHYYEAIRDKTFSKFNNTPVSNNHAVVNDLKQISGYEQLFGNQNFCDCEHCRSIFSPAAYFTDLMHFVDINVTKRIFTDSNINHPLKLKRRRPDLWTLILSCENTSTEIPYLDIVNEVLENYLKSVLNVDVYDHLAQADYSIDQPFNLVLEQLRLYLTHFNTSLYDIYLNAAIPKKNPYREKLKLSEKELQIITSPDLTGIKKRFGNRSLQNFDVQEFIKFAHITRSELDELLTTGFFPEIAMVKVKTIKDNSDIQKYSEVLEDLTDSRLDLIHRYLRLWKKTPWTLTEFDIILNSLKSKQVLIDFHDTDPDLDWKILQLAPVFILAEKFQLSPEELASVIYQLPETPVKSGKKAFAERLFNLEKLRDTTIVNKVPYILSGLGIKEQELSILQSILPNIDLLQPDIDALSSLYRHSRLARALQISISDLRASVAVVLDGQPISSLEQIEKLVEFVEWFKKSKLNMSEWSFILESSETTSIEYKINENNLYNKILEIQHDDAVLKETELAKRLENGRNIFESYVQAELNITKRQWEAEFKNQLVGSQIDAVNARLDSLFGINLPDPNLPVPFNSSELGDVLLMTKTLERCILLFNKCLPDPEMVSFLLTNKPVFGISDLQSLTNENIYRILFLVSFCSDKTESKDKIFKALADYQLPLSFAGNENILAAIWEQPESFMNSIIQSLNFNSNPVVAMQQLKAAVETCLLLGIQGSSLNVLANPVINSDYKQELDIVLGAFQSKFENEKIRKEKAEPYLNRLNTLKRDALCDYIISRKDLLKFSDREDLYSFFLLSVEMGGCAKTTRVLAGITSVQLYIHRCSMNLEQSDPVLNPEISNVVVPGNNIPPDEWEWRKNYRVWEANRRVFLYPENYIEPTHRSNKTHIFKELEDELLQQKITKETAENSYKKYISQFSELTRLRYAGAFYHSVKDTGATLDLNQVSTGNGSQRDTPITRNNFDASKFDVDDILFSDHETEDSCYYLFARTNIVPYQYYYRTYNDKRKNWGNWTKMDLGIEAKEISAVMHRGHLHIFWTEVKSKEINTLSGGTSESGGHAFKVYVKFSSLNENSKWSAPQRLYVGQGMNSNSDIYCRARNVTTFDPDRWSKEKDNILETFENKVFRKPFTSSDLSNEENPIGISYIWSPTKSSRIVTYFTSSYVTEISTYFSIAIPAVTFQVQNNDFSNAVQHVQIDFIWHFDDFGVNREIVYHLNGNVTMNPGSCTYITELYDDGAGNHIPPQSGSIPFQITESDLSAINQNSFRVSLSRNEVANQALENIYGQTPLNELSSEYDLAYSEDGNYSTHIEDGTAVLTENKLLQNKRGAARLEITDGINVQNIPIDTVLTELLSNKLNNLGIEGFLSLTNQELYDDSGRNLDFRGPYGEYYWELFFHIPFLIANHFNAEQKFKESKWWYERIFNPFANEEVSAIHPADFNWQFKDFRGLSEQKLKDIMTDTKVIEEYKRNPFDPHAIARLRVSAYQKSIVMKYIDNLLDWGDSLFTRDTRESINEAEMLYRIAWNILGRRPLKMGKCETAEEEKMNYENISKSIDDGSEFLISLENYYWTQQQSYQTDVQAVNSSKSLHSFASPAATKVDFVNISRLANFQRPGDLAKSLRPVGRNDRPDAIKKSVTNGNIKSYSATIAKKNIDTLKSEAWSESLQTLGVKNGTSLLRYPEIRRSPATSLVTQGSLVFCVPENKDFQQYYDRVDDRLFKIWNCMNIKGVRRSLAFFEPPIDPMLLVRARAAGLSIEDAVANALDQNTHPHYRFLYLIEKARQFTQTVQSFGSSLLSALEKKDGEELLLIRTVHEKNIQKLTKEIKKKQIQEAKFQLKATEEGINNIQNRINYYSSLIETGLIPWEITEAASRWTAGGIRTSVAILELLTSVFGFLPQAGSPFAMKYGGSELNKGTKGLANALDITATIADNVGLLAGIEASHKRREEEWKQQLHLAQQELVQANQQLLAAQVRVEISEKDLEVQEKNIEQLEEQYDFYKSKFTSLGLYNFMASTLSRIYRTAYNMANEMAMMAQQAYQFETFKDDLFIQGDNWISEKAGLLAGENLLLQLQQLEANYIRDNERVPELTRHISLAMLNPLALLQFRASGSCSFEIPEAIYDLDHPGHYSRIIKSVSISIPCIAGPYTSVSAKLSLLKSRYRKNESLQGGYPEQLSNDTRFKSVTTLESIATSTAQNDSGMFELNFNDQRYLPFEGAGAISEWELEIPGFPQFDFNSIADVIIHLKYTAKENTTLRVAAHDSLLAQLAGIRQSSTETGLHSLINLKHDMPNEWHKLKQTGSANLVFEKTRLPYLVQLLHVSITKIEYLIKGKTTPIAFLYSPTQVGLSSTEYLGFRNGSRSMNHVLSSPYAETISLSPSSVQPTAAELENLDELILLIKYVVS